MWLARSESITPSHHLAKLVGHRLCGGEDIIFLVCHVPSRKHMINETCDFVDDKFRLGEEMGVPRSFWRGRWLKKCGDFISMFKTYFLVRSCIISFPSK